MALATEIVFETHALTVDNESGRATGWLDGRLSAEGRDLALEVGRRRRGGGFAVVVASDLGRAVETAEIAFAGSAIPVFYDARPRECDYGAWNGGPVTRLAGGRRRHVREPFPGGESYLDAVARVGDFLAWLATAFDGDRVLLIGHSATRWALDHLLAGAGLEDLVDAPFDWREGWEYTLPTGWPAVATG